MDTVDFRILLELHRHPFASFEGIGRTVRITGTAVKARLERMEARGVVQGFYVAVAAPAFRRWRRIHAFANPEREPAFEAVTAVDEVVFVWRGPPGMFMVTTFDASPQAEPPTGLVKLFGGPPVASVSPDPPDRPSRVEAVLSPLDWRVVDALLDAPRASLRQLASAAGLTAKTVRHHRDRLVAKGLLEVAPILDTSREPGLIVYSGYVGVARAGDLQNVRVPGMGHVWIHHDPAAMAVLGRVSSYGEIIDVERQLRSMPGVTRVVVTVARGGAVATPRLRTWILAERERWRARAHGPDR